MRSPADPVFPKTPLTLPPVFRALRHRNYRLFFFGQGASLIGTWMQQIAMSWLVYRLTGSVLLLGVVGFADKIAIVLVTPFAGVLLDRVRRDRVVLLAQILLLLEALVLAVLTLSGAIEVWQIMALSVFLGLVNAIDIPARQSFTVEMIEDKEDLGNAIALNSIIFNGARLLGPSIGGILIGLTSEGFCFLLNAASYLAVVASLLAMKTAPGPARSETSAWWGDLKEGFNYAFAFPPTRTLLLFLALVSLMGIPYTVLMPVFAGGILGGGPETLGLLMAATGGGALAGAWVLARRRTVLGLGNWIVASSALFALGIIAFSFSRVLWISLLVLVFAGFGMMVHIASSNTVLQTIVEEGKRGRMMSFYVMAITGMAPFGSLLAGALASAVGAANTLRIGGSVCLLGTLWFTTQLPELRRHVRPIYARMGILPQEAVEIESSP